MSPTGLEAALLANRDKLRRFLIARGAGEDADDLIQDLWLKLSTSTSGPAASPMAYLYRAANTMMIDRYRSRKRAERRDREWIDSEGHGNDGAAMSPAGERAISARQEIAKVAAALAQLGVRKETVFRRIRIDRVPQRQVAEELGVSISTVENDLRIACRTLAALRAEL